MYRRVFFLALFFIIFGFVAIAAFSPSNPSNVQRDPQQLQSLSASDGRSGTIRVVYPGDWIGRIDEDASISLANSPFALRTYAGNITNLQNGMTAATVSALTRDALPDDIPDSVAGVLDYFVGRVTRSLEGGSVSYTFGTVNSLRLNDKPAAYSDGLGTSDTNAYEIRAYVVESGTAYGIIFFAAPFGELETHFATIEQIAASFTFQPQ